LAKVSRRLESSAAWLLADRAQLLERTRNVAQLRCSYGECHSREIIAIETP
jgi:hypothetical protein